MQRSTSSCKQPVLGPTLLAGLILSITLGAAGQSPSSMPRANQRPPVRSPKSGLSPAIPAAPNTGTLLWSVDPPVSTWNLTHNQGLEFVVTLSGYGSIKALRITHSTLADSDSDRAITIPATAFRICSSVDEPIEKCNGAVLDSNQQPSSVSAQLPKEAFKNTLWLKVEPNALPNGVFAGNLVLDTDAAGEPKTLSLTIEKSSWRARAGGLAFLVAGVVIAWFVTVFARSRINRDQALLPIVLLGQKLKNLHSKLSLVPSEFANELALTLSTIGATFSELTIENLDANQLLPPRIPAWTLSLTTQPAAYQTFLQHMSQVIEDIGVIVAGIESAAVVLPSTPVANRDGLRTLIASLDALSGTLPQDADALRGKVQALIAHYSAGAIPQTLGLTAQPQSDQIARPITSTPMSLNFEIQTVTLLFWLVWGGLSVIIGFTLLVKSSPGFGVYADFVRCALWGFGLPVAGQGLQQLTVSSVNTQLGINLPK